MGPQPSGWLAWCLFIAWGWSLRPSSLKHPLPPPQPLPGLSPPTTLVCQTQRTWNTAPMQWVHFQVSGAPQTCATASCPSSTLQLHVHVLRPRCKCILMTRVELSSYSFRELRPLALQHRTNFRDRCQSLTLVPLTQRTSVGFRANVLSRSLGCNPGLRAHSIEDLSHVLH